MLTDQLIMQPSYGSVTKLFRRSADACLPADIYLSAGLSLEPADLGLMKFKVKVFKLVCRPVLL